MKTLLDIADRVHRTEVLVFLMTRLFEDGFAEADVYDFALANELIPLGLTKREFVKLFDLHQMIERLQQAGSVEIAASRERGMLVRAVPGWFVERPSELGKDDFELPSRPVVPESVLPPGAILEIFKDREVTVKIGPVEVGDRIDITDEGVVVAPGVTSASLDIIRARLAVGPSMTEAEADAAAADILAAKVADESVPTVEDVKRFQAILDSGVALEPVPIPAPHPYLSGNDHAEPVVTEEIVAAVTRQSTDLDALLAKMKETPAPADVPEMKQVEFDTSVESVIPDPPAAAPTPAADVKSVSTYKPKTKRR